MNTLPFDYSRCTGGDCPVKSECERYLAWSEWDEHIVPDYKPIPVMLPPENCQIGIFIQEGKEVK